MKSLRIQLAALLGGMTGKKTAFSFEIGELCGLVELVGSRKHLKPNFSGCFSAMPQRQVVLVQEETHQAVNILSMQVICGTFG